jgi:hypothetical protein
MKTNRTKKIKINFAQDHCMIPEHAMLVLLHQRCIKTLKRSPFNPEVRHMSFSAWYQKLADRLHGPETSGDSVPHGMNPDGHGKDNGMINRRGFLGTLAALSAVLLPGVKTAVARPGSSQPVVLCRCFIAGFQFHQGPAELPGLTAGQRLALKREPQNPYDPLAIAVHAPSGSRIGYLPRRLNDIPSFLMDSGHPLEAVIAGVAPSASPWEAVEVEIRFGNILVR